MATISEFPKDRLCVPVARTAAGGSQDRSQRNKAMRAISGRPGQRQHMKADTHWHRTRRARFRGRRRSARTGEKIADHEYRYRWAPAVTYCPGKTFAAQRACIGEKSGGVRLMAAFS